MRTLSQARLDLNDTSDSYSKYIDTLISVYESNDQELYYISINNFQNYVIKRYQADMQMNDDRKTINEIFKAISCQTPKNTLIIYSALIDIDFSDNRAKANRMATYIMSFEPEPDPSVYIFFESILQYLYRSLRSSILLILQPIRDKVWSLCGSTDPNAVKSGIYTLILLIRKFPFCIEPVITRVQSMIAYILHKTDNEDVRHLTGELLVTLLKSDFRDQNAFLASKFATQLVNKAIKTQEGFVLGSEIILEECPELKSRFSFSSVDFENLDSPILEKKLSALSFIPFQVKTSPDLFDSSHNIIFFTKIEPMLHKKLPNRNEALISFGKFIFNHHHKYSTEELKYIEKCKKAIFEALDCEQALYAYLAALIVNVARFKEDSEIIFKQHISPYLLKGFTAVIENEPSLQLFILNNFLIMADKEILNEHPNCDQLELIFDYFVRFQIPTNLLTLSNAIQYSKHLYHPDFKVRSYVVDFLINYQNSLHTEEIVLVLLTYIGIETEESIRVYTIKFLSSTSLTSKEIISSFQMLLTDFNRKIRLYSSLYLTRFLSLQNVENTITQFLTQSIRDLKHTTKLNKDYLEAFLVLSKVAFSVPHTHNSDIALSMLTCYSSFIVKRILDEPGQLFSDALEVLSYLVRISPKDVNEESLVRHLMNNLVTHSSKKFLNSALKLFISSIQCTSLKFSIYNKNSKLINQLIKLTNLHSVEVNYDLLFEALSMVGAVNPSLISYKSEEYDHDCKTITTANSFITQCPNDNPQEKLVYASVGVAISHILHVLAHDSLAALHSDAVNALVLILKSCRLISESLTDELVHRIDLLLHSPSPSTISTIFSSMQVFLAVVGEKCASIVPTIVNIICDQWQNMEQALLTRTAIHVLRFLPEAMAPLLPKLTTRLVKDFESAPVAIVLPILNVFEAMENYISTIDYIAYPPILSWIILNAVSTNGCREALIQLKTIFAFGGTVKYASIIIHTMLQAASVNKNLTDFIVDILTIVAVQVGKPFLLYVSQIRSVLAISDSAPLMSVIRSFEYGFPITDSVRKLCSPEKMGKIGTSKVDVKNQKDIQIQINKPSNEFDEARWKTWGEEFYSSIISHSPLRAIEICALLAERHNSLKDALTPISITMLYLFPPSSEIGSTINSIINTVFSSDNVPRMITRIFLEVLQLLEFLQKPLPITSEVICQKAISCEHMPMALRFAEVLFDHPNNAHSRSVTEEILLINQQLGLPLANKGILTCSAERGIVIDAGMKEKLGLWDQAYEGYEEQLKSNPNDKELMNKALNCLQKMFQFQQLKLKSHDNQLCKLSALWHLLELDEFAKETRKLTSDDPASLFYQVILNLIDGDYDCVQEKINKIKAKAYERILLLISEDYERSLSEFSTVSLLYDLESVLNYKQIKKKMETADFYDKQNMKIQLENNSTQWQSRFDHLPDTPFDLYQHICIRSLVLSGEEMKPLITRLINSLVTNKQTDVAVTALKVCPSFSQSELTKINAMIDWSNGKREQALNNIIKQINESAKTLSNTSTDSIHNSELCSEFENRIVAGRWLLSMNKVNEAKAMIEPAISNTGKRADVWKLWSKVNLILSNQDPSKKLIAFDASINGLLYCSDSEHLMFTLPILSALFSSGNQQIFSRFKERAHEIVPKAWIDVLPQIIAHFNSNDASFVKIIEDLLYSIGIEYPHTVLYSLMIPLKCNNQERQASAQNVIEKLRQQFPNIIGRTLHFTKELIRIGSSWWELWQTQLDEAARAIYSRNNDQEMLNLILPLFELISHPPETLFEVSFARQFGAQLYEAHTYIKNYEKTRNPVYLHSSWKIFHNIFRYIKPIVQSLDVIPLADASPSLSKIKDEEIVIPGAKSVTLKGIKKKIKVLKSQQRPRKLTMTGSDGLKYTFLLKANEDTRLDERVMQLFGFINRLVQHSSIPLKNRLNITTYKVIPLTSEMGLIGWVQGCQTVSNKIMEYRKKINVPIEAESQASFNAAGGTAQQYNLIPLDKKLNVYLTGFRNTKGDDMEKILLLDSSGSEHWLSRRTLYTASLAMTSMAGYILGLGDRHLSNIMFKEKSAKLVHIDFGDCFEVTQTRQKFPEKVPFRLTRILKNGLEVSKIEGTFRTSCENVMSLIRSNSDQISGLLEVFEYDPLLQWIIVNENQGANSAKTILRRINDKLKGRDFNQNEELSVSDQVDKLIKQATDDNNLCQMFHGWYPWW
ncbi:PIKK family atypical protein kinase [Tritrichomonas foetus]|uniref:non-specific serine/threonine protein kinase n=1 Tax=Tritrichomonas foetus TaxID=1144522 RepID=A0A1J4KNZ8_9EUKA|nr:PIKK family atypical protein kinase [Tritrichomonas foetus]|eukprot:OHT13017.1 PIKK family atypical protein kinase [Tritrichomonas foetus]